MNPKVTISRPGTAKELAVAADLRKKLMDLAKVQALVGVTQGTATRRKDLVTNAELMYIHSNGSPARHIPIRKVIEPAIAADGTHQAISAELKEAAIAKFHDNDLDMLVHLRRAGIIGRNASVAWFTDPRNNWPPNKPATIKAKGSDRPLIGTGALRASITWVIREVR
jgi:hypothetical protein